MLLIVFASRIVSSPYECSSDIETLKKEDNVHMQPPNCISGRHACTARYAATTSSERNSKAHFAARKEAVTFWMCQFFCLVLFIQMCKS